MNLLSCGPGGGLTIDEYIAVYHYPDMEKVGSHIPTNSIQDSRASLTPLGLAASDVLCSGVHETHDLRLEYYTTEKHETPAQ